MRREHRIYTDAELIEAINRAHSISDCLSRLGLLPSAYSYDKVKADIHRLDIDISHWNRLCMTP